MSARETQAELDGERERAEQERLEAQRLQEQSERLAQEARAREQNAEESLAKADELDTRGQAAREAVRRHEEAAAQARDQMR